MPDARPSPSFARSESDPHELGPGGGRSATVRSGPSRAWALATVLVFVAVVATEPRTPLGFAHGTLYLLPLLLAARFGVPKVVWGTAIAAAAATAAGLALSPPAAEGTPAALVVGNRAVSVGVVLLAAVVLVAMQRSALRRLRTVAEAHAGAEDARRRLETTLASITDAFFVLGPDWRFRYLNDQALRLLRRDREELLGAHVWEEFPHAVGSPFQAHYERAMRDGTSVAFEAFYPAPLDAWFEVHAYPSDEGLAVYFQDVTARVRDRDRLRLLETAVERLNDAVVISEAYPSGEAGRRIVYVNPAFERIFGWKRSEAIGSTMRTLLQDGRSEEPGLRALREAYDAFRPVLVEVRNVARDGREVRIEVDAVPIAGPNGRWTHWVAVERDVTERRALEDRVRRTQRLESLGHLTGGVAHDFNNLLTVVTGNTERLAERVAGDPASADLADTVLRAAERGSALTRRLLVFARRQPLRPRATDVRSCLDGLHAMLRRTVGEAFRLDVRVADDAPTAWVDPHELENAVLNLALNARDALTRSGTITIEVDGHRVEGAEAERHEIDPGRYLRIRVRDDGRGIDPEDVPRLFEPFFTTKESGRGNGLGLATVYGFARQSGGQVQLRSSPGEGTEATLLVPATDRRPESAEPEPDGRPPLGRDRHVLVVEDDELVRTYVKDQLRTLGYRVTDVADGASAVRSLEEGGPFDLLFTDVVMPGGMDGRELAVRARSLRPDLPVLFTSGYAEEDVAPHGRLEPGAAMLRKPYRRTDLARAVDEALQSGPAAVEEG